MKEDCIYKKYEPLFGSWFITEKIGEGAIAQVYSLERHELGVTYRAALKAITIPESPDEVKSVMADGMTGADLTHYYRTIVQNVVSEFDFMSRLKGHSHIVNYEDHTIIEHEDDIGWDILVRMELLTPLVDYSLEHPLTEADVLRLGSDICKALEYCRQFNILHRDVKPENIFVAPGGGYKLGDFGIARVVEETRIGLSRKGTYTYMAPEVYRGGAYGPTSDIYSLGMVMYKYLNDGRNPFMPSYPKQIDVEDYETAFARRISGAPIQEPAHGSRRLKKLILKACAPDPKDRFHSAAEFRKELDLLLYKARKRAGEPLPRGEEDAPELEAAAADRAKEKQISYYEFDEHGVNATKRMTGEDRLRALQEAGAAKAGQAGEAGRVEGKPGGRRRQAGRIALITFLVLFLIAGVVDAIIPDKITAITGIDDTEEIYIGESLSPTYTIEPDWFKDEPITFSMADDKVATVDDKGRITADAVGETTMEIAARDYTRQVAVDVIPKVTKISGVDDDLRIEEGSEESMDVKLSPKKFSDEPITYTSEDKDIVTVSKKGKLTAKEPGKTKVKIEAGGCEKEVSVEVYEYVPPAPVYTYSSSGGSSKSSGSSGSSGSSKSSKSKKSSGKSGGYFSSGDDEYF